MAPPGVMPIQQPIRQDRSDVAQAFGQVAWRYRIADHSIVLLGLSDPNVMSWGLMIGSNRRNILECWWAVTFPGAICRSSTEPLRA